MREESCSKAHGTAAESHPQPHQESAHTRQTFRAFQAKKVEEPRRSNTHLFPQLGMPTVWMTKIATWQKNTKKKKKKLAELSVLRGSKKHSSSAGSSASSSHPPPPRRHSSWVKRARFRVVATATQTHLKAL